MDRSDRVARPHRLGGTRPLSHAREAEAVVDRRAVAGHFWVRAAGAAVGAIDGLCRWTGDLVAWAALGTVLLCFASVYLRYVLGYGIIWLQESYIWTHVAVIVPGAGYTMMSGGVVRVDVF